MKISLVAPGFLPQLGGIEVVVGHLADELSRQGHRVMVYAQRPRGAPLAPARDYPVRQFASWTRSREFPIAPGLLPALWRDRERFDLIHAHGFHAVPAMMAATVPRLPFVFTPHFHGVGHTRAAAALHTVYDPLAAFVFRRASKVTCVSVAESELLLRHYPFVEPRLAIVPNGVETQSLLAAAPFATERPVVLVAGRIEPYKRIEVTVRALAAMREDARLVICGTGSGTVALKHLADELGVAGKVSFLGHVTEAELRRWQRTATSTVSLSEQEAFGLVLLEAAVAGSRVVASNIPAHAELAQRLGGLDGPITLVAREAALVAATLDRQIQQGRAGALPDAGFDWSATARQFEAIYRSVS